MVSKPLNSRQVFWLVLAAMRLPESSVVRFLLENVGKRGNPLQKEVCALSVAGDMNAPCIAAKKGLTATGIVAVLHCVPS